MQTETAKEPTRLNIGSGPNPIDGYVNLDIAQGFDARKLEYPDESVDEIRASHILEHFSISELGPVGREWLRVLKPGGWMKISVPDIEAIAKGYLSQQLPMWGAYIYGSQSDQYDYHKSGFDRTALTRWFKWLGLVDITDWKSEAQDCAALPISLNLKGRKLCKGERKSAPMEPHVQINAVAIMSCPNLGHMANFFSAVRGFIPVGIQVTKLSGVFWGQCLTEIMRQNLHKYPYIYTFDYDTYFGSDDVVELYRIMEEHPEADAACGVQMKRESNSALLTALGSDGGVRRWADTTEFDTEATRICTGHFGLTLLRTEKLKRMPLPWFLHTPAPDGGWGEGRVDEDIYFWRKWAQCGNTLYQANYCVLGHIQPMVTWPDKMYKPVHQYLSEAEDHGMPEQCRRSRGGVACQN